MAATKNARREIRLWRRTALAGIISVLTGSAGYGQSVTWDSGGATPTNPTDGAGSWDLTTNDWSNGTKDAAFVTGDTAVFGHNHGAAGTVTISSGISAAGLTFNAPGSGSYIIAGPGVLTLTGTPTINVNATSPTISAQIAGSAGLESAGSGSLTLSGTNTYTGTTTAFSGTLITNSIYALGNSSLNIGSLASVDISSSLNVSGGSVGNSGNLTIGSGATLSLASGSPIFNQASGALAVNGALQLTSGTFNYSGGTLTGNAIQLAGSAQLTLGASVSSGVFDFVGTTSGASNQTLQLASSNYAIPSGVTLNVLPGGTGGELSVPSNLSNAGVLTMTAPANGLTQLYVSGQTFNNSGTFNISGAATASSPSQIQATVLTNTGTFNVSTNLNLSSSTINNSGNFTITNGVTIGFSSGSVTFNQSAGTLAVNGTLQLSSGEFNYSGGTLTGNAIQLANSASLQLGAGVTNGVFTFTGGTSGNSDQNLYVVSPNYAIPSGVTINDTPGGNGGELFVSSNLSNAGILSMTIPTGGSLQLDVSGTAFNNSGTFTIAAAGTVGSVVSQVEVTTLTNTGTFNVNTSLNVSSGTINNSGTFNIANGATLGFSSGSVTFNQSAGTLAVGGTLQLSSGEFNYSGGTLTGNAIQLASSSSLQLGASVNNGTFTFKGGTTGNSDQNLYVVSPNYAIPSGVTINDTPGGSGGELFVSSNLSNAGILSMTIPTGGSLQLDVSGSSFNNSGTFTIAAAGTVSSVVSQVEVTTLTNTGTFNVNTSLNVSSSTINNSGTFNVASGATLGFSSGSVTFNQSAGTLAVDGTLQLSSGEFNYSGGTLTGNAIQLASSSSLQLGASVNNGTFTFKGGTAGNSNQNLYVVSPNYAIPSGITINDAPGGSGGELFVSSNLSNAGVLSMTIPTSGSLQLDVSGSSFNNSGTFTIAAAGTVSSVVSQVEVTTLTNTGTFNVNTSLNVSSSTINNSGTFNVASGATLGFSSGSVTFNQSAGTLAVNGTLQLSTGEFNYSGGTLTGNAIQLASSSSLQLGASVNNGTFTFKGGTAGNSNQNLYVVSPNYAIPSGITINDAPGGSGGELFVSSNLSNAGVLSMTIPTSGSLQLDVSGPAFNNSGAFTIAAAGTVGSTVSQVQATSITNSGYFNVNSSLNVSSTTVTNSGNFTVPTGSTLGFSSTATLKQMAGIMTITGAIAGNVTLSWTGGTLILGGTTPPFGGAPSVPAGGALDLQASDASPTSAITVAGGGTVNLLANPSAGILVRNLAGISINGANGHVNATAAAVHTNRQLIYTQSLSIYGAAYSWAAQVDLGNNDMDVVGGNLSTITNQVAEGYAGGQWNGEGIASITASINTSHLTALGVIQNTAGLYGSTTTLGLFDGISPAVGDVLVKYTYYGDANLDGAVDGSDYSLIDAGFQSQSTSSKLTGWYNGDFNYDGKINGSDYTLIDNAFNTQGATLGSNPAAVVADATSQFAGSSSTAVPEPAALAMAVLQIPLLLRRRRVQFTGTMR